MVNGEEMTPEERSRKIDERLGSIARNLELLSGMHRHLEEKTEKLTEAMSQLAAAQAKTEDQWNKFIARIDSGLDRFARVLQIHEHRLDQLEGN